LQGVFTLQLELSTDDVSYTVFTGASAKGEFRYARVRINTAASPGTATAFVKSPLMNLRINVVPLEESGESTSSATAGVGDTVVLTREYTALKEIMAQPKNKTDALTAIVDNIIIGPNTGVQTDLTNYLDGGDIAALDFGTGDFTIEIWTKHGGDSAVKRLIGKVSAAGWRIDIDTGVDRISGLIEDASTNTTIGNTANGSFPDDGDWHHIAMTIDRTGDNMRIYIDGVEDTNSPFSTAVVTGSTSNADSFVVGAVAGGGFVFAGPFDEIRIWDDVRTASELLNNKDAEVPVSSANLVGYWKLDGTVSSNVGTAASAIIGQAGLVSTGAGDMTYIDPGNAGNIIQKINSFDVFIFDVFGQQLAEQYQWKWKAV